MRHWKDRNRGESGASSVEFALLLPWIIFLFVGAYDWGFYAHALISTESATRVAAVYAAQLSSGTPSTATACSLVLNDLSIAVNVSGLNSCGTGTSVSTAAPVAVSVSCTTLDGVNAATVGVTYQTIQLVPIPGFLAGQATIYRTATLPMNNNSSCTAS
jgi:Flp pilus assembly protein TadG